VARSPLLSGEPRDLPNALPQQYVAPTNGGAHEGPDPVRSPSVKVLSGSIHSARRSLRLHYPEDPTTNAMTHAARLFTLLLAIALAASQGLGASAGGCAGAPPTAPAYTAVGGHQGAGGSTPCRSHHPNPQPYAPSQHCAVSVDCASSPALPPARPQSREVMDRVSPVTVALAVPPSDSPEPQAPPPRSR
jgi:hypothetical protein